MRPIIVAGNFTAWYSRISGGKNYYNVVIGAVLLWKERILRLQLQFFSLCCVWINNCNVIPCLYMILSFQNIICNKFVPMVPQDSFKAKKSLKSFFGFSEVTVKTKKMSFTKNSLELLSKVKSFTFQLRDSPRLIFISTSEMSTSSGPSPTSKGATLPSYLFSD